MGRVLAIAVKTARKGPMREIVEAEAVQGGGLLQDLPAPPKRGLTILSREKWTETACELGKDLPWFSRRANVLVGGIDLAGSIGRRMTLGTVEIEVLGETEPCSRMEEEHPGLFAALVPECRGGVYGCVVSPGILRVGDRVSVAQTT